MARSANAVVTDESARTGYQQACIHKELPFRPGGVGQMLPHPVDAHRTAFDFHSC